MLTCTAGLPPPICSALSLILTTLLRTTSCSLGGVASRYLTCTCSVINQEFTKSRNHQKQDLLSNILNQQAGAERWASTFWN